MSVKSTHIPDDSTNAPDVTKLSGFTGSTTTFLRGDATFAAPAGSGTGVTTTGTIATTSLVKFAGTTQITSGNLSGDATTADTLVVTLATTGVGAGTYGSSTAIPILTVDAKGRITAASTTAFSAGSGITELTGDVLAGPGSGSVAATLSTTGVAASTYGSGAYVPVITVDAKGRLTAVSTASIAGTGGDYVNLGTITTTGTIARFTSLGAYTHLDFRFIARGSTTATTEIININFNDDTGANYDVQVMQARNATVTAAQAIGATTAQAVTITGANSPAGQGGGGFIHLEFYRSTTFHKNAEYLGQVKTTTGSNLFVQHAAIQWHSTAAITTVSFMTATTLGFASGSSFTLYGIS